MCAINGITAENRNLVLKMNEATKHRGPDGSRVYVGDGITLGHNRLAIIDLEERAAQPMVDADGRYSIVFNGEIYNYRELREELTASYDFKTESDTEVLLAAYVRWGEAMFPRLRGVFAFGIWDSRERELTLARDHMGVKPLYYRVDNGVLRFSSELPALLIEATRALDLGRVGFYLSMEYVPGPATLVEGVSKLRPGELLRFKGGVLTTRSFLEPVPDVRPVRPTEVYETIDSAVKRQLVSDRPIGAYLSGGFDSSIVVHHMAKYASHPRTYSVDFEAVTGQEGDTEKFNADASLAKKTSGFYGTKHTTFTVTLDDIRDSIETVSASASEPVANSTAVTQYLLSDFVRKDGTVVVLGGDGGDELFGGYTRHRIASGAYLYQKLPQTLRHLLGGASARLKKLDMPFGAPLHMALMVKDEKNIRPFLSRNLDSNDAVRRYFDAYYDSVRTRKRRHPLATFMEVDRETWLPDECFIRSDYASMAHGVELRVPMVDTDVVRLSDEVDVWRKTMPWEGKRVIRQTYRTHLPPHLYGQPKRGWLSPAAKWFRDPAVGAFAKEVYSSAYYGGLDGLFDWDRVRALLDDHIEKRGYYLYPLWNILVLQIWARRNGITIRK